MPRRLRSWGQASDQGRTPPAARSAYCLGDAQDMPRPESESKIGSNPRRLPFQSQHPQRCTNGSWSGTCQRCEKGSGPCPKVRRERGRPRSPRAPIPDISRAYQHDPSTSINFDWHRLQRRTRARAVDTQAVIEPEERAVVSTHQHLRPVAGDFSRLEIERD
jgi:hypothetical protein